MDLLFIALAILVVWYVLSAVFGKHKKGSQFLDYSKEQARNKAHREAMKKQSEDKEENSKE